MRSTLTINTVTTYYLYDDEGEGGVPVAELTYAANTMTTSLAYLNGVCADGWRLRYVGGVAYVETYDPQGTIVQSGQDLAAGQSQYARATYLYDGFGALRGWWSSAGSQTNVHQDPAGFGGQYGYYQDLQTGLEHLGARYYDGGTGRFVTRDPIGYGGGENLYAFCGNNPINESDPEGMRPETGTDVARLWALRMYARASGIGSATVDKSESDIESVIAAVPTGSEDPANLRALFWAIDELGDPAYGRSGTVDNHYTELVGPGQYKCNLFGSNAYAIGAKVGWNGATGIPTSSGLKFWEKYPYSANALADRSKSINNLPVESIGVRNVGDIAAFQSRKTDSLGHATIYAGGILVIYASLNDVKVQTIPYVMSVAEGHFAPTYRRYR